MKRRILFVDDEPKVLHGLRRMLRGMRDEWEMAFAESGAEALEILSRDSYDVVVSDMRMPKMDGAQLLSEIRDRYPKMVRIVLSGHSDKEMILKSVRPAHQYLSKPCDSQTLKSTVKRACTLRDLLSQEALTELVSQMEVLPSLPSLYSELMDAIQSPDSSMEQIGGIISRDLAMTTKVLQLVNSAFFGVPRHISDPAQAVNLLGIETVKALVLTVGVFSAFIKQAPNRFHLDRLWNHSIQTGAYAREIAQSENTDKYFIDDAFMGGLLHDVGKLVLATSVPDDYGRTLELTRRQSMSEWEAETRILKATHAEVGAYLLGLWGIPDSIVEAIAFHHQPERCPVDSLSPLAVVYVANLLEHELEASKEAPGNGAQLHETYLQKLGLMDRGPAWQEVCSRIKHGENNR